MNWYAKMKQLTSIILGIILCLYIIPVSTEGYTSECQPSSNDCISQSPVHGPSEYITSEESNLHMGASSAPISSYTVEFHYQGIDYSIPGQSQILLSELIRNLRISMDTINHGSLLNVSDVSKVYFSNDYLMNVSQVAGHIPYNGKKDVYVGEKDFLLTSEQPFDTNETLKIELTNGKVIELAVTDAAGGKWTVIFQSADPLVGVVNGKKVDSNGNVDGTAADYARFTGLTKGSTSGVAINNAVTAKPLNNKVYTFKYWQRDDGTQYTEAKLSNVTVTKDNQVFTAYFAPIDGYFFYFTSSGHGTVDRSIGYSNGEGMAIPTPDTGYHFAGWRINGNIVSESPVFDPSLASDGQTVTAVFEYGTPTFDILYQVEGEGSVSKHTGTNKEDGATATPESGWHFAGWKVNGNTIVYTQNPFNSAMVSEDSTVTAVFEKDAENPFFEKYYFTVNPAGEGNNVVLTNSGGTYINSPSESAECQTTGNSGASQYYAQPVAGQGYRFVNWTNNGKVYRLPQGQNNRIQPEGRARIETSSPNYHETDTFVANFIQNGDYLITLQTTVGGTIYDDLRTTTRNEMYNGVTPLAVPSAGYHCMGWQDENGNYVTYDRFLYGKDIVGDRDAIYTAVFEKIQEFEVYYRSNGSFGTVTNSYELIRDGTDPIGSTAVPRDGTRFVSWVNQDGETVWPLEVFTPFADLIYNGAIYTAVFESAAYSRYLMIQADTPEMGYVISPEYENSVNGHIVSMYVKDDGTIPADLIAVAYEDYTFDHWEATGNIVLENVGATIPAGFDLTPYLRGESGWTTLLAVFKDNTDPTTHRITYIANQGGSVIGVANKKDQNNHYYDEWVGYKNAATAVKGANATADTGWIFTGWLEQQKNGSYIVVSTDPSFVPAGDLLKDTTYYAAFRPYTDQGSANGLVGYNMCIADVPVTWSGVNDLVVSSSYGTTMYYDTNNGWYQNNQGQWVYGPRYFKRKDLFHLDYTHFPEAEGYYFVGWYNKDRNWIDGDGNSMNPATSAGNIIKRGSYIDDEGRDLRNIYFPFVSNNANRYTFEAMYIGIDAISKRLPYDGAAHYLPAAADFFAGEVTTTERFRQQLNRIKNAGGYTLGTVYYQLYDDNGNPVGEPKTEFSRIQPGLYKVRAYADCNFDGTDFRVYKDITLEIYAAKIIVKKFWKGDTPDTRPDDLETTMSRYNQKTQGVKDVNKPVQLNAAKEHAADLYNLETLFGRNGETAPSWNKNGNVWTMEYNNVLVRPENYGETDQTSGYYLFFDRETVPDGYAQTAESWERSDDMLTTTITFTNTRMTLDIEKHWYDAAGEEIENSRAVEVELWQTGGGKPDKKLEDLNLQAGTKYTYTVTDYNPNYTYYVIEHTIDGYITSYAAQKNETIEPYDDVYHGSEATVAPGGILHIRNMVNERIIEADKKWLDIGTGQYAELQNASVTLKLQKYLDGQWIDVSAYNLPDQNAVNESEKWHVIWDHLERYVSSSDRTEIPYRIVETNISINGVNYPNPEPQPVTFQTACTTAMLVIENPFQQMSTTVGGNKRLVGREMTADDTFTFIMEPAQPAETRYPGLPEGNRLETVNHADGSFAFDLSYALIEWENAKNTDGIATFTYKITERIPESAIENSNIDPATGILYDTHAYWVQIDIGLDTQGKLVVKEKRIYTESPFGISGNIIA